MNTNENVVVNNKVRRKDKKKVLITLIVVGLLLSNFIGIAYGLSCNFVGSKKSDVYHYPDCRYVDRITPENLIYFDTPEDAIAKGYRPCKVCKPPTKSSPSPTPTPIPTPTPTPTPIPTPSPTPEVTPTPIPSQLPIIEGNSSLPHRLHRGRSPSRLPITEANLSYDNETLRIGAFNIQVFGKSKAGKPEVMDLLAKIIRTYDLVAIQEIRDKAQTALPKLVNLVNANGSQYEYIVGPRLGRTTSKEQYAYIYNNQMVKLNGTPHIYPEPNGTDPFHREPYIASFKALNGSFDVTLIVIHADPDEATEEINALDAVVNYTQNKYPDEQDFIVMGDLNADCSYFDEDSNCTICAGDYYWCINNSVDTTTSATNCTYDRIIITNPAVSDYTGDSGVFRYDLSYNLTEDETRAVSDHYPIYAEFYCDGDIDTPERGESLSVNSSPLGATIYLDGSYKGKTPRTIIEASLGDHTIKLTLEGYYDWSTSVNAKAGETSYVNATLEEIPEDTEEIPTPTPCFEFLFAIMGLLAAIYLIRQKE